MAKIAFIGLGVMGYPMAVNLVRAGHEVAGHTRKEATLVRFAEAGGRRADSVKEAVSGADIVITMLPDSPDVAGLVEQPDGIYDNLAPGGRHVDCSTIRPDVARRIADLATRRGLRALDAPVSGGEAGAIEGSLSIMVGGEAADFDAVLPVLESVGRTIVHVGPHGAGQTVKAANQLIVAGNIQLLAEALVFLEAHDVDAQPALRVLGQGLAGSTVLARKGTAMLARDFAPGFRIDLHHKDLGIVTAAAREAGVALPMGAALAQLMQAARCLGYGHLDHAALLKLVEAGSEKHARARGVLL